MRAVPVEFLTDQEAAAYGRFDGVPSREELERAFFLDDADKALIAKRRGSSNNGTASGDSGLETVGLPPLAVLMRAAGSAG
jgi:hypothetical protein